MNRRFAVTASCVVAIVGVALYFSIHRDESRSKAVRACLANNGLRLDHLTQELAAVPPSERVAELTGTVHGHLTEVIFFSGRSEREDALNQAGVDLDDWSRERGLPNQAHTSVMADAIVGWSASPSAKARAIIRNCLGR